MGHNRHLAGLVRSGCLRDLTACRSVRQILGEEAVLWSVSRIDSNGHPTYSPPKTASMVRGA